MTGNKLLDTTQNTIIIDTMKPLFNEGDNLKIAAGRTKTVTDIIRVKTIDDSIADFVYELDDDFDQRYTTDELQDLLADS